MITSLTAIRLLDRKTVLIGLTLLCLIAILVHFFAKTYQKQVSAIETKMATLQAQNKSSRQLPALKKELALLENEIHKAEALLFHGTSVEAITSTIQIRLQTLIRTAGLEPEALHPVGGAHRDSDTPTIAIKLRMNGSLENLSKFLAALYQNDTFFLIESCTLKPDRLTGMKIFMDLKAFYSIQDAADQQRTSPGRPQ